MRLRGNLLLITAAFIWGTTFVAQQVGMDALGPFSYAAARYVLGVLAVLLIWCGYRRPREAAKLAGTYRSGWKAGIGAGIIMFAASSLQQVAMRASRLNLPNDKLRIVSETSVEQICLLAQQEKLF